MVLQALHMAAWRRKPNCWVLIRAHNLEHSMSRSGNCHDIAVAESFFQLLKRERIRRKTYGTREEAKTS